MFTCKAYKQQNVSHDCSPVCNTVPGAPFYPPPTVCPEAADILGACNVGECVRDADCEGKGMCCPNNCNKRICVEPIAASPACEAVVNLLSPNVSYVPECLHSGDYRPLQCSGATGAQLCWCVNVLTGVPYTSTYNDRYPECERKTALEFNEGVNFKGCVFSTCIICRLFLWWVKLCSWSEIHGGR